MVLRKDLLNNLLQLFKPKKPLQPEELFVVTINETFVRVEHPDRKTEEIAWRNIKEIMLINTEGGPWVPDIFLALIGENDGCLIPHGSKGFNDVYEIVSKYNGFNFENVGKSMRSTNNEKFLLWAR